MTRAKKSPYMSPKSTLLAARGELTSLKLEPRRESAMCNFSKLAKSTYPLRASGLEPALWKVKLLKSTRLSVKGILSLARARSRLYMSDMTCMSLGSKPPLKIRASIGPLTRRQPPRLPLKLTTLSGMKGESMFIGISMKSMSASRAPLPDASYSPSSVRTSTSLSEKLASTSWAFSPRGVYVNRELMSPTREPS